MVYIVSYQNTFAQTTDNPITPVVIDGDSGIFVPAPYARKVLKDYKLLDNTLKRNTTLDSLVVALSKQVAITQEQVKLHRTDASQWKEIADKYKAQSFGFQQLLVDEQKLRKKQRIKAICLYVILPAGAGAMGYVAGRYLPR